MYINKMSGTLLAGNLVGTNIGVLHVMAALGGNLYGTNRGIFNIV